MAEYIEREAVLKEAESRIMWGASAAAVYELIRDAPAADVAPVVRCRDCKHRGTDDCIFHIKGEPADEELLLKLDNDFCSYGERKGDADND